MQVAKAAGSGRPDAGPSSLSLEEHSDSYAPLYMTSGLGNISFDIEHLQELALARLRLLKAAGDPNSAQQASSADLRKAEREHGFHIPPKRNSDRGDVILKDEAAHFLVRLALCRSHEHRQWFLARECALFAARLQTASMGFVLDKIRAVDGPDITPAPADVLREHEAELDAVARGVRHEDADVGTTYFQVAFEHVPALVRSRRVLVRGGVAFVPAANVRDVVASQFRARLNHALVTASKAVGVAEADPRMGAILGAVRERHAAEASGVNDFDGERGVGRISLNELMGALPAMPLCQMNLMHRLGEDHHLRHAGRMQLGVFLKGCGLTMDESLVFWQREFGKGGIDAGKFNKNYAYNIRHHYGKEGKRKNLQPFPCIRIINDRPGPGEHHGCPYREFTPARLRTTLYQVGTKETAMNPIMINAKDGNYQAACGLCFAATQPGAHEMTETGTPLYFPSHPNDYFIEARTRRVAPRKNEDLFEEDNDEDMAPENSAPVETPVKTAREEEGDEVTPSAKRFRLEEADPMQQDGITASESPIQDLAQSDPRAKTPAPDTVNTPAKGEKRNDNVPGNDQDAAITNLDREDKAPPDEKRTDDANLQAKQRGEGAPAADALGHRNDPDSAK